jgi:hypothetical protein
MYLIQKAPYLVIDRKQPSHSPDNYFIWSALLEKVYEHWQQPFYNFAELKGLSLKNIENKYHIISTHLWKTETNENGVCLGFDESVCFQ